MFSSAKKPKPQRFEISWPVESNRDAGELQQEAPSPASHRKSPSPSTRSVNSRTSSHSSYYLPEEHHQPLPALALPPKTYKRMAESSRSLPLPPPPRHSISSIRDSHHSPSSSQSSRPSYSSSNTAYYTARRPSTAAGTISSCDDGSCQMGDPESDLMFERYKEHIDISDNLPDAKTMGHAGEIPIFDSEGNSRPFKTIYSGELAIGEQQMVLFVRHFFCGVRLSPIMAQQSHANLFDRLANHISKLFARASPYKLTSPCLFQLQSPSLA
jgi:hypothetical protein